MFNKVLIANRGEIAVRIIRACRELEIPSVSVCSEADRDALHAQIADETICIGPPASKDSYLNIAAIISACSLTGANAIHPGFGFLSENAPFAAACERCGITFIGPSSKSIALAGDKAKAKETMRKAGVPVIPGSEGIVKDLDHAKSLALGIGYPLLIKASAGGGGRGIRLVTKKDELEKCFYAAKEEAKRFFGNNEVYLEKFLINPKHVEIQIVADNFGNIVHLGERDCSMQRRNQKILEETPCPSLLMTDKLRDKMGKSAIAAAKAVDYQNVGTVEFLLDANGDFYFMEMNTRIQVEHTITEEVTGIDLVQAQLRIAAGEKLWFTQSDIKIQGHSIECRINAECPKENFRPSPGTLSALYLPGGPGIRVDGAVYSGYKITPFYDNMMAKLIVHAPTREQAILKMRWALAEFIVDGVDTNIDFHLENLRDPKFLSGNYDIGHLERRLKLNK